MVIAFLAPVTSMGLAAKNGQNVNEIEIFSDKSSNHELKN